VKIFRLAPLLKQVEPHRNEVVKIDGLSMPKSAAMLMWANSNGISLS
jgi:hypothetical protein